MTKQKLLLVSDKILRIPGTKNKNIYGKTSYSANIIEILLPYLQGVPGIATFFRNRLRISQFLFFNSSYCAAMTSITCLRA